MKNFFLILISLLLLTGCMLEPTKKEGLDTVTNYYYPINQNPIAIIPTFEYLGKKNIESEKAYREYHIWKHDRKSKYILLTILRPKGKRFPENVTWIDKESAIYSNRNIAAYSYLHKRPESIIVEIDGPLPDCIIVAQEFYLDENRTEAIYKALIVPDEYCTEDAKPVIEELNRVANMQ